MGFDVWTVIDPQALRVMHEHVLGAPHTEVGGFLVGEPGGNGKPPRVDAAIESHDAEGDLTHLTFTHESWAHIYRVLDEQHPDSAIIGWYHSHPGHGIFLSGHDQFIQRNFFPAPWQIAIVLDPVAHTEGFFVWARGEILKHSERPIGATGLAPATAAGRAAFTARKAVAAAPRRRLVVDLEGDAPAPSVAAGPTPVAAPARVPAPASPLRRTGSVPPPSARRPAAPSERVAARGSGSADDAERLLGSRRSDRERHRSTEADGGGRSETLAAGYLLPLTAGLLAGLLLSFVT